MSTLKGCFNFNPFKIYEFSILFRMIKTIKNRPNYKTPKNGGEITGGMGLILERREY